MPLVLPVLVVLLVAEPPADVSLHDCANERYKLQPTAYDRAAYRELVNLSWEAVQRKYASHFYKKGTIRFVAQGVALPLLVWWYFWDQVEAFITEKGDLDAAAEIERRSPTLSQTHG